MHRAHALLRWLLGIMLVATALGARAQLIDDVSVQAQGSDTLVRVSFNGTVRFLQQSPTSPSQLYQVGFEVVGASEALLRQSTEERKRVAAGANLPDVNITYNASPGQATKQLTVQLSAAAVMQARQGPSSRTIDLVFSQRPYIVVLQQVPSAQPDKLLPVPNRLQTFEVFSTNRVVDGTPMIEVSVGWFRTAEEAEAVRQAALDRFPQARVVDLLQRNLQATALASPVPAPRSASVAASVAASAPAVAATAIVAAPTPAAPAEPAAAPVPPPPPVAPAPTVIATPDIEARAAELMTRARTALSDRKLEEAIDALNQLLLLPPNSQSQEAQELIGLAWERAGDLRRARVEYELYLKLYPQGEGTQRVAQRLASLEGAPATGTQPLAEAGAPTRAEPRKFTGNIAQYYYGGKARSQSLVNLPAGIDQSTLTKTTESAIVTSVDLGGRFVGKDSETRVVLRGTGSSNLSSSSHNTSLLNAAYVDYKRNESGLAIRLGRQSAISGGLLGLFDGVSLSYPIRPGFKVDVMGGAPANLLVDAPSQRLMAAMLEADGIGDHWGGDLYIVNQTTEGIANRRSLGGELRYSGERGSGYALVDYDTLFRAVNAVSLQGSVQAPGQTTVTVLIDSRKAPSLQMTNALISSGFASLKTMLQVMSLDEVRDAARNTTAQAKQGLISVSRPLSEKWQLSADLRYSAIGALPAVGDFEATPATGAQYGLTLQFTGSNLYSKRDINNFNVSLLTTPFFKGTQLSYSNLTGLRNNDLTLEPSLRFYTPSDKQDVRIWRITPGLRASYRLSTRASILGEGILEHSKTSGPTNHDKTDSVFFYFGYRYELF